MVGLWLPDPVFGHGQFYVGCGRVGAPERLRLAVKADARTSKSTRNVVFREVLTDTDETLGQTQPEPASCATDEVGFILRCCDMSKLYPVQDVDPVEAHEMPEYEGEDDDMVANFNLELDEDDLPSLPRHKYNLRPRQKRSISPARNAAPPPRTVPR